MLVKIVFADEMRSCQCCGEPYCDEHGEHYSDCGCVCPDNAEDEGYSVVEIDGVLWGEKKIKNLMLDLYCKAGGAGMGYKNAGFEVIGVDIEPQRNYPFDFLKADAIDVLQKLIASEKIQVYDKYYSLLDFAAIHASPPCQKNSTMTKGLWKERLGSHPELIAPTRELLKRTGLPYIIENVPTAPLINPTVLCGSMFGLGVRRHRLFETSFPVIAPPCNHAAQSHVVAVYGHSGGSSKRDGLKFGGVDTWKTAMQINWMTGAELAEAIPPAYTEYIAQFIK